MNSLLLDIRQAVRGLRRAPASAIIAVVALGLGIGLTTMMFSIIYGALMRGLPVEEAHEIMAVERLHRARGQTSATTIHDLTDWREQQRSFEALGAYWGGTVNVSGGAVDETPERFQGAWLTPSVLRLLGVQPILGRTLLDEDDVPGAQPVALIGHGMWQRRFQGAPDVVGRSFRANGVETLIIGVMPDRFGFPQTAEMWQPARLEMAGLARGEGQGFQVVGRLRDGVDAEAAAIELNRIADRLAAEYVETNEGIGVRLRPFTDTAIGDEPRAVLLTMFGAVGFVLLIACANVANLLIGRAMVRSREVGIRTSLGASRLSVAMPFLAESAVLAVAGAVLGTVIGYIGLRLFTNAVSASQPPYWLLFQLDGVAFAFVAALAVLCALLAGVIPALQAARMPLAEILKDESRGASSFRLGRLSRGLVIVEMALSVGLLAGAGLMIKSVIRVNTIDLGFPADAVFTARLGMPQNGYATPDALRTFHDELLARLQNIRGARHVALADGLPGTGSPSSRFTIDGVAAEIGEEPIVARPAVSPGYFSAFDVVPEGRDFGPQDREGGTPVAIVNTAFVERWFPDGDVLGRRIRMGGVNSEAPWLTIVGIVPDLRAGGSDPDARREAAYVPLAQNPLRFVSVIARADGAPLALTSEIRDAVLALDRDIPIYWVRTLAEGIDQANWFYGIFGSLFAAFGLAALFLAGVGLYGVMSFSVGQRTRELGVRMAIGAQPAQVMRMVLSQGMRQVLIGLAAGTLFALAVSRLLAAILFEVSPRDPAVFVTITGVLIVASLLACGMPARRATRVDPLHALRSE
jgi:putative ABC transport system permease protein